MSSPFSELSLSPTFALFIALFCVLLNAFFVAAEFSMVKIRSTRLESLQGDGNFITRWAFHIVQNLNDYLSATQLGVTLSSLGLGWVGEPAFAHLLEPLFRSAHFSPDTMHFISFLIAFGVITALHLVIGELVPKQIAIQTAEKVLVFCAIPMRFFYIIFYPFLWGLIKFTNLLVRLMGFKATHSEIAHSEDEIRLIVEDSYEEGSISPRKASLLENVFEFTHRTARHIMIPRRDINYLLLGNNNRSNLDLAKESGHTRFPLCDGDLDKVIGLINIKDVIWEFEDQDNLINLYDLKRPILFVPEGKPIDQLLREFQSKKIHMAIVVDEFGSTIGLVTLEDVIEEIVGEIQDEFDQEQPKIFKQSEDVFIIDGSASIREVEQALDVALHDETNVSIAGFFVNHIGRLAKEGDFLILPPYRIKALEVKNRRV
ncbi:MAG: HlyC/CorC family transporter, partial [Deltaproteobacteria bacterium]|nr:HlyC/CorC family transporter [Deltaproteobacteria bacterium]